VRDLIEAGHPIFQRSILPAAIGRARLISRLRPASDVLYALNYALHKSLHAYSLASENVFETWMEMSVSLAADRTRNSRASPKMYTKHQFDLAAKHSIPMRMADSYCAGAIRGWWSRRLRWRGHGACDHRARVRQSLAEALIACGARAAECAPAQSVANWYVYCPNVI